MFDGEIRISNEPGVKQMNKSQLQWLADWCVVPELKEIVQYEIDRRRSLMGFVLGWDHILAREERVAKREREKIKKNCWRIWTCRVQLSRYRDLRELANIIRT